MEERICRICLTAETTNEFTRIFDRNLALKIFLISHVKIVELSSVQALLCRACEIELYRCINFRKKIQSSQEYFNSQLYGLESSLWNESEHISEIKEDSEKNDMQDEDVINFEPLELSEYQLEEMSVNGQETADDPKVENDFLVAEISPVRKREKGPPRVSIVNASRLTCQYCGLKLSRRQRLIQHERLHSVEATKHFYTCDLCGKQMNQIFGLIPHFQKHHNYTLGAKERWRCAICENKTLPACKMEVHYQRFHSEFYKTDDNTKILPKTLKSKVRRGRRTRQLTTSSRAKHSKIFFPCSLCGNSFTNSYRYHKHLNDIHEVKEQEILQNDGTIEILLNDSVECTPPQKNAKSKNHLQELKKSKNVPCSQCGKVFSSITTCKAHEKTHLDTKYECDLCGSSFKVKAYLTSHVQKVHLKLKRFKCSICSAAFVHRELLNYHVKKHLNIRNYSCQYCQKTFVRKACALIHERIHKNERPYSCKFCDRTFIHNSDHRRHELRHLADLSHKSFD